MLLLPFSDVQPRLPFPASVFPVAGPSLVQLSLFFLFAPVQALVSLLRAIVLLVKLRLFAHPPWAIQKLELLLSQRLTAQQLQVWQLEWPIELV